MFWTMKPNFKILADKFSVLNEQDNKAFISFYKNNENEIENLKDFDTDEELYLSAVINHTYGRSLLYEIKDYEKAERYLEISRSLILNNKSKFNLDLTQDIWYLQTLQHLLKISRILKNYNKSRELLKELKLIDSENVNDYRLEAKEINRIKNYKFFTILVYGGMGLIVISIIFKFLSSTTLELVGRIGMIVGLVGLIGGYLNKDRKKNKVYNK